jgi:hypothetical protein
VLPQDAKDFVKIPLRVEPLLDGCRGRSVSSAAWIARMCIGPVRRLHATDAEHPRDPQMMRDRQSRAVSDLPCAHGIDPELRVAQIDTDVAAVLPSGGEKTQELSDWPGVCFGVPRRSL